MKNFWDGIGFGVQILGALFFAFVIASFIRGCTDAIVFVEPARPEVRLEAQRPEPPLAVWDQDRPLLDRLMPHIRQAAKQEIENELKKVADDLDATEPKSGRPVGGTFSSALAAAIAWFVQKVVYALIGAAVLAVITGLFWAYWIYPATFLACWTAVWTFLTAWVARGQAKRAVAEALKPAPPPEK